MKSARDEQGTKRIQDFLLVVVFYVKNRLLATDIRWKGFGENIAIRYTKLKFGGLYEARI